MMVPISKIVQARRRLNSVISHTPLVLSPHLCEATGCEVYLKSENLQITGAYKIRGAYNKISSLSAEEKQKGVITASAGNHAQGVAHSAKKFGVPAIIVMPFATPLLKVLGTKQLGAEVLLRGDNFDEAFAFATEYAQQEGLTFIHPFDDEMVMAGQGTIALEMLDAPNQFDYVVVPVGGGGLISGVASAIKQLDPRIRVIGATAKGAPAMYNSFQAGKVINSTSVRTIADGIAVRDVSPNVLSCVTECVDDIVQVDDEEIANAILFLLEKQKIVVEGGGAAGVAAILHHRFPYKPGERIATILSGGNIDVQALSIIIEKGLIKAARRMTISVTLIDKPGALMELTTVLQSANANIIKIDYDRFSVKLAYGDAKITITLETKGEEHKQEIRDLLAAAHYEFSEIFE